MKPTVGIIILNYKLRDKTSSCVKSALKSDYQSIKIIVVDNNSNDGIEEEIQNFPDVEFIQNKVNLGYSGGNNIGIKKALSLGCEYIFILNPDTEIDKQAVSYLVWAALESKKSGILGPKVLFQDKKHIWYAGGKMDLNNVLGSHRGVNEDNCGQYENLEQTDYVTGGAMFVKKAVFKKIGLFDERYFLYYEDADLCFRAKQFGFDIIYVPKAIVYHANASSTGLGSPLQDYFITRNRLLFGYKFLSKRTRFALWREAIRNIGKPYRRMAFLDYLLGNFGKGSFIKD